MKKQLIIAVLALGTIAFLPSCTTVEAPTPTHTSTSTTETSSTVHAPVSSSTTVESTSVR
jgi:hypothetical protein